MFIVSLITLVAVLSSFILIIFFLSNMKKSISSAPTGIYGSTYSQDLEEQIDNIVKYTKSGESYFKIIAICGGSIWAFWTFIAADTAFNDVKGIVFSLDDFNKTFFMVIMVLMGFLFITTNYMIIKINRDAQNLIKKSSTLSQQTKPLLLDILDRTIIRYFVYILIFSLYFVPIITVLR